MRSIAAIAMLALLVTLAGGGSLLARLDQVRAEQRATDARVRLAEARVELVRAIAKRDVKPVNDTRVEACERRTEALRAALLALVRTGNASMTGDPSWEWAAWR